MCLCFDHNFYFARFYERIDWNHLSSRVLFSQCYRHIQMTALKNVKYFTTQCVEVMVELTRTNAIWPETTVLGQKRKLQRFTKENVWRMKKMKQKIESEWWLSCYCCCCQVVVVVVVVVVVDVVRLLLLLLLSSSLFLLLLRSNAHHTRYYGTKLNFGVLPLVEIDHVTW